MFAENLLWAKPAEFLLKGINKLPDNWQEAFQNDSDYSVNRR